MTRYAQHVNDLATPQRTRARADEVENNAGGFVFTVDKWTRLDRFLILGAEGGTYYVGEKKLTQENAECVRACLAEDGERTVRRIAEISDAGRAPKNDPAIFALAMASGDKNSKTRAAAMAALPRVCRIGTHLFHFVNDVQNFRGWGPGLQKAVARWYTEFQADKLALEHQESRAGQAGRLAYQIVKYQQRDGWAHRDLLRLAHPKAKTPEQNAVFRWVRGGRGDVNAPKSPKHVRKDRGSAPVPAIIEAFGQIHSEGVLWNVARDLIVAHRLPHECVPNEFKNRPEIWEALLEHMGIEAVIRNLGKMTNVGLLKPMSDASKKVAARLSDSTELFKGRVHPIKLLLALKQYETGHGFKGSLTWSPVREIIDGLDEGFYLSFQHVEPSGKRSLLALDVSGSMGSPVAGTTLSARECAAAMAMVTARVEKTWHAVGFAHVRPGVYGGMHGGGDPRLEAINISPKQRLDDVIRTIGKIPMGGTDCSLPMRWALAKKIPVDIFHVYTDNETWAGPVHPYQALEEYRRKMGINAKLVVVGMVSNGFTIADPNDAGMLDVVGFDAAAPGIIADFAADREVVS